jgi:hypothetical protein
MAVVKLDDVVEAIDTLGEGAETYMHRSTGEFVYVTDDFRFLIESEIPPDDLPAWQREALEPVRAALDSSDYLLLPTQYEIHDWQIMGDFATSQDDPQHREALLDAIHGAGAFRNFRSVARRLGLEDAWYDYRHAALEKFARNWLDENEISYSVAEQLPTVENDTPEES